MEWSAFASFLIASDVLGEFQTRPSQKQHSSGNCLIDREWIRTRLKQELLNQALGVAKGDEVEATIDAQIQAALEAVAR